MSLSSAIRNLASDFNLTIKRRVTGVFDADGVWQPGAPVDVVLPFASIQPATGEERVIGGRDMRSDLQGQQTNDVRIVYSPVELLTRKPTNEPDQLIYDGGVWTVIRAQQWTLRGQKVHRALITRETRGAS